MDNFILMSYKNEFDFNLINSEVKELGFLTDDDINYMYDWSRINEMDDVDDQVDFVFDTVVDLLLSKKYPEASKLLLDLAKNSSAGYILKSALAASYPWRFVFESERDEIRRKIEEVKDNDN